jgi:predicted ATPase/DNA-binding SARP family transcriptional activator
VANEIGVGCEFRILGPVEAARAGKLLQLGGRRQRALLALLLLDSGRAVLSDRLIEELWHGHPPAGAERTLRAYVSRLRSALGENVVSARSSGYVLEVAAERLDARRFDQLLREGRDALARGAAGLAADRLRAALGLWRGPALADVADGGMLALEAQRLDELRLACMEERIDAELALGRHAELAAELERLVAEQPFRERFWRQLVLALFRCERQADALAAYRRARRFLSEELGLEPGEELQALERDILRHQVAKATPFEERHNLPAHVSSFIGRERELRELRGLLREQRLVTLTGTGGVGKTRLALAEAARQVGIWRDGVWLVDLAAVTSMGLVASAVAGVLAVAERPGASVLKALRAHLRSRELLLVLDNCEHLAPACGEFVHEVLQACENVRVLVTSRVVLGVPGEVDYKVEPLPTPAEGLAAGEIERFASVRIFLDRGRGARRDLAADGNELETVARICRELDGLPLAIELAAARANVLSLKEIAARLGDRFRFLRSWRRITDARHQTLRAAMDWSYELLSQQERALLGRLSAFAGGFSLDAVAKVCLGGDETQALELVGRLVESSLVVAGQRHGGTRYRLLETIREYAAERLEAAGEGEAVRRRHVEYLVEIARKARWDNIRFDWQRQKEGLAVLDLERDNLHAAVQWTLDRGSGLALPLTAALHSYWLIRGTRRQGLAWLEQALALPPRDASPDRAEALTGAALLARLVGDFARALQYAEEAIEVGRAAETPVAVVTGLNVLVTLAGRAGDFDRASAHCTQSVQAARAAGSMRLEALALFIFAETALHAGRYADARHAGGRALELFRTTCDQEGMALVLARLGLAAVHEGRLREAATQLDKALQCVNLLGFAETGAWCCEGLALVAASSGEPLVAARLLGAAETLRQVGGGVIQPAEAAAREQALAAIAHGLPDHELAAALEAGRRLSLDAAAAEARAVAAAATG